MKTIAFDCLNICLRMLALWLLLALVLVSINGCATLGFDDGVPTTQPTSQPTPQQEAEISAAQSVANFVPAPWNVILAIAIGVLGREAALRTQRRKLARAQESVKP
jgi:hypothetical protein